MYELDPTGAAPPRLISEGHGGLNAFEVAHDGMIYGPLVFGGRVVKVDPDTGEIATVSDEFESPGALKLAGDGTAFVLEATSSAPTCSCHRQASRCRPTAAHYLPET